ncbi:MAG: exodeoxyribonuclease VII large subunit [Spirochaetaceae bacterium]|nr:exodeoxyribonuclease VII large subunit [Spirochaetaceae bacterium]
MYGNENHCYSVSEVTASIKMLLESRFPQILMEGEISNYRPSSAGHCYFSLKDNHSIIQAVIFRGDVSKLPFKPGNGMKVRATGRISVYPQRGNYQIICSSLEESGKGNILEILEERKQGLAAEGLFSSKYKKEIPQFPETLVVITSPTGAALRDILQVLKRRKSPVHIRILPCAVQGDNASVQIVKMIEAANKHKLGDLILLSRGGGSIEDLLPFSEENVVRAISSSYIPVITGIGHEIDFSLSDFVADLRAATPSAAAELVCESSEETLKTIEKFINEMEMTIHSRINLIREKMKTFSHREISLHLKRYLDPLILHLDDIKGSMQREMLNGLSSKKHAIELVKKEMEGNSPLEILKKGYSHVSDIHGLSVTDSGTLKKGDHLNIRFASGKAKTLVEEIE